MKYKKDRKHLYTRNGIYCFRRIWKDENGASKDYRKSLDTNQPPLARKRRDEVLSRFDEVTMGVELSYSWEGHSNRTTIKEKRLDAAVEQYIKHKRNNRLTESSIKRIKNSLNNLIKYLGSGFNYNAITLDNIDGFKNSMPHKTPAGLNVDIRNVRAFCNWLWQTERINRQLPIKQVKEPKRKPQYLTESDIVKLLNLESLSGRMKRIIQFYISTGLRCSSVFYGHIKSKPNGNYLVIPADAPYNKAKKRIEILINQGLHSVWLEMIEWKKDWEAKGYKFENLVGKISKEFKRAIRECGIKDKNDKHHHLHNTRHTFAVMDLFSKGNIHALKKRMGHSNMGVTEMYSDYEESEIAEDFEFLAERFKIGQKPLELIGSDTVLAIQEEERLT